MNCEDCGTPVHGAKYCAACHELHAISSAAVQAHTVSRQARWGHDLFQLRLEIARERLRSAERDLAWLLENWCHDCGKKTDFSFRSRDGHVRCQSCFVDNAKQHVTAMFKRLGVEPEA